MLNLWNKQKSRNIFSWIPYFYRFVQSISNFSRKIYFTLQKTRPKLNVRMIFNLEVAGMLLKAYRPKVTIIAHKLSSDVVHLKLISQHSTRDSRSILRNSMLSDFYAFLKFEKVTCHILNFSLLSDFHVRSFIYSFAFEQISINKYELITRSFAKLPRLRSRSFTKVQSTPSGHSILHRVVTR